MRNYILFEFNSRHPHGGWRDLGGFYDSAWDALDQTGLGSQSANDSYQVVSLDSQEIVAEGKIADLVKSRLAVKYEPKNTVELKDLVGTHWLSGVDYLGENHKGADVIRFVLDGVIYAAYENEEDGYRSSLGEIEIESKPVLNMFRRTKVMVSIDKDEAMASFADAKNGKEIMAIGTGNWSDYYPYFVASFDPKSLHWNDGK